jgi:plastocyanin
MPGKLGKRGAIVAGLAAVAISTSAGTAWGAPASIVGQANDTFNAPVYAHDAGTVATLTSLGNQHNVTASAPGPDGQPLFRSATISGGSTPVNGTQFVAAGAYTFFCTVHPSTMVATLAVSGTPLPRPNVALRVLSGNLDKVAGNGKLRVRATNTGSASQVDLTAKLGKKTIGTVKDVNTPAGQSQATLKLSKAGKSRLGGRGSATVKVEGTVDFGSPATAKRKLR